MNSTDRARIRSIHSRYDELCNKYGDEHDTPKLFYLKHRNALENYYADGRWCGPVANENGWTP